MQIIHVKSNTAPDWTGVVTIGNSTGGTQTINATDLVRPADWNSNHALQMTLSGNTLGQSTISGDIVFAGGNNLSLSVNGATLAFVGPDLTQYLTTAQPPGAYLTTAMASNRGSDFVQATAAFAGTNASGTIASNGISISVAAPGLTTARASNDAIGLNTALTANGVSMTANSSGLSLNFPAFLTSQSNQAFSAAGGSSAFQTLSFADNVYASWTNSNGSVALTELRGSLFAVSNTTQASSGTQNLDAVSFGGAGIVSVGITGGSVVISATQSNQAASAANGSFAFQTLSFSNLNGISFGTSAGSAITASHNALTTARASTDAIGLNTAQSNVTWTVNSSGLSLDARGYAGTGSTFAGTNVSGSMTVNSVGVNLALSGVGGGVINQTGPNIAAGTQTATSGTVVFSNSNGITFGMTNQSIVTASFDPINIGVSTLGNTSGATGTIDGAGAQFVFVGSNNITLSQSINGQSVTMTISGRPSATYSGLILAPFGGYAGPLHFAQSSASLGQNSLYIYPVQVEDYLTCDHIRMPVFVSNSSSASASVQKGQTFLVGIYTRNATNATVLTRHYSTSYTIAASHNSNASWALSMITAIGNSTSYNSVTASSAGVNLSASLHGPREFILPVSSLFPPGEYWFAVANSSSSAGAAGSVLQMSNLAVAHQTFNRPGVSTASSLSGWQQFMGAGVYSATTGALPNGISLTQINQAGTFPVMFAATGTV
mgnify:CR=1 FL=1